MGETTTGPPPGAARRASDYNLRIVWPLARFVEEKFGATGLAAFGAAGGLAAHDFDGRDAWVDAARFEALLAHARGLLPSDDAFMAAAIHRLPEAYGPLRYVLWALTPGTVFSQAARQYRLVSTCGEPTVTLKGPTTAHFSFVSHVPYSRLNCLLRQAQSRALPTFWGLPPAYVNEHRCIGRGDDVCEFEYHWYAERRFLPAFVGAVLAALLGWVLSRFDFHAVPTPLALAVLGAAVGHSLEVRRTERVNERTRAEVMAAVEQLAHGEADARRELLEMHRRQRDWTRLVEEEMSSRSARIQEVVESFQEVASARASTLLGFSHDLRNPLQLIQMSAEYLESNPGLAADADAADSLADIHQAVERMRRLLGDLVRVSQAQRAFVTMTPQHVRTGELSEVLRRRLRGLLHGRDLRSAVLATREAPEAIDIDPLALDRILDNLLTNAAKYTERGSIVVQLDGAPGYLVIKVSDTGCGIAPEALEGIFHAGGSSVASRRGDSFGVGLSVVVQLLGQIGGRLEVMSRPGAGTTFWVLLPLAGEKAPVASLPPAASGGIEPARTISGGDALSRVVRIRNVPA